MNAETILKFIIELLLFYIEDLKNIQDTEKDQFQYGAKTAYTECLELLQKWEQASKHGLNFDIEKKYPL